MRESLFSKQIRDNSLVLFSLMIFSRNLKAGHNFKILPQLRSSSNLDGAFTLFNSTKHSFGKLISL